MVVNNNKKGNQMKQQTLPEIQAMIMNMDNDEMNSLIETIKFRRSQLQSNAKKLFKVGDKVYFISKKLGAYNCFERSVYIIYFQLEVCFLRRIVILCEFFKDLINVLKSLKKIVTFCNVFLLKKDNFGQIYVFLKYFLQFIPILGLGLDILEKITIFCYFSNDINPI